METIDHSGHDADAEGTSSGYDSSDYSSDEGVSTTSKSRSFSQSSSNPSQGRSHPSQSSGRGDVMMLRSTGDLQDSLSLILNMPDMCDVTFLVGKEKAPVHGVKAIMATRSRYLYQLLLQHQKHSSLERSKTKKIKDSAFAQKLTISIPDYQIGDSRAFLKFVHSGKANIDFNNVVGLLCASVEFGFSDLQTACMQFVQRCQNQGHGPALLDLAWTYQNKRPAQKLVCQFPNKRMNQQQQACCPRRRRRRQEEDISHCRSVP
ncbi:serine-enriched protein-like [Haliotis rufescens]|uniref:serine-enriched protein-like n=1 Tax=Haliotis rufescens TaxID=6454 RepID=UPI00201F75B2|nr:serine-enriched protein-like [Haliotis rufescens]